MKGFREQLKAAKSLKEARQLMSQIHQVCPLKYIKRCEKVFSQLPFTKEK